MVIFGGFGFRRPAARRSVVVLNPKGRGGSVVLHGQLSTVSSCGNNLTHFQYSQERIVDPIQWVGKGEERGTAWGGAWVGRDDTRPMEPRWVAGKRHVRITPPMV